MVTGWGSDISRLLRSMASLSLPLHLVALPWDGPLHLPTSTALPTTLQLLPTYSTMPEFMKEREGEEVEVPLTWPLVEEVVGAVVQGGGGDIRQRLGLSWEQPRFRVDQVEGEEGRWVTVGTWVEGELEWSGPTPPPVGQGCSWCKCSNGGWGQPALP